MHKKKASLVPLIHEEVLPSDETTHVVDSPMNNSVSSPSLLLSGDLENNSYFISPQKLLTRRSQRIQTQLCVLSVSITAMSVSSESCMILEYQWV